jgi:hypothetical protein
MMNILYELKLVRFLKKGLWVKTLHRGWIRHEIYDAYLGYGFDPIIIKTEKY